MHIVVYAVARRQFVSLCLTRTGIVSKQLNISSKFLYRLIALLSYLTTINRVYIFKR